MEGLVSTFCLSVSRNEPFAPTAQFTLSSKQVEMTGSIVQVDPARDSRPSPRAWIRTIHQQTVFVAIYSKHTSDETTYMNIALPLRSQQWLAFCMPMKKMVSYT